jgi:hypothetical protein
VSLKWYRPYATKIDADIADLSYAISDRKLDIFSGSTTLEWDADMSTWRGFFDLRAHGSVWNPTSRSSSNWRKGHTIAWQERISLCEVSLSESTHLGRQVLRC